MAQQPLVVVVSQSQHPTRVHENPSITAERQAYPAEIPLAQFPAPSSRQLGFTVELNFISARDGKPPDTKQSPVGCQVCRVTLLGTVTWASAGGATLLVSLDTTGDVCASATQPPIESRVYKWLQRHEVSSCAMLYANTTESLLSESHPHFYFDIKLAHYNKVNMDVVTTPIKGDTDTATESASRSEPHSSAETIPRGDNVSPADSPSTPSSRPEINSTPSTGSSNSSSSSIFSSQPNDSSSGVGTPSTPPPSAEDAWPKGRDLMPCAANSKGKDSEQLFWRTLRSKNSYENKNGVQRPSTPRRKGKDVEFGSGESVQNSDFSFRYKADNSPSYEKAIRENLKSENRKREIDSHSEVLEISDEESNSTDSSSEAEDIGKEEAEDASYKPPAGKRTKISPSARKSRSSEVKTDSSSTAHPVSLSEDVHAQLFDANVATDPTVEPDFVAQETNDDTEAADIVEPSHTSEKPAVDASKADHIKFEQYKEMKSRSDIKIAILSVILQEDKGQSLEKEKGFVYIYKLDSSKGHVKIGKSRQKHGERVKQWAKSCKLPFQRISDPNDKMFLHYGIVEKLAHAELSDKRKAYKCEICKNKGRIHDEWFEVTESKALEVIERWRGWLVQQQPYGRDGTLRGIWTWKRDKLSETNTDDLKQWVILTWPDWSAYAWYRIDNYLDEEIPTILRSSLFINAMLIFVTRLWYY
ncbi:hypothetical protein V502_08681 [Pseudogymnoascus sp. VKM F-4520 (FW-2644)]|nr:hypothetical protein V502_08681 [Pseudogymnoascus sp. VKM F-4520 (FW-2644)]